MSVADLVRQLTDVGTDPALAAGIVAEAFARGAMSGTSPGHVRDTARAYERDRKAAWRANRSNINGSAGANDAADGAKKGAAVSGTVRDTASVGKKKETLNLLEGSDPEPRARGRGTRLAPDWQPDPDLVEFCRSLGVDPQTARAEFVDYWIGVPGSRGVKLDWPATFRNRVRDTAGRQGGRSAPKRTGRGLLAEIAMQPLSTEIQNGGSHEPAQPEFFGPGENLGDVETLPPIRQP